MPVTVGRGPNAAFPLFAVVAAEGKKSHSKEGEDHGDGERSRPPSLLLTKSLLLEPMGFSTLLTLFSSA